MKYRKILLLILLNLIVLKVNFPQITKKEDIQAIPLKSIGRLYILLEVLPKDMIKIGLTEKRLNTFTELRLRREGIKIYKPVEWTEFIKTPCLYIDINSSGKAFNIFVGLQDRVKLLREPSIECKATTWNSRVTGTYSTNPEFIVSSLSLLLDEFLNDYYKANPKK